MTERIVTDANRRKHITTESMPMQAKREWVGLTDEQIHNTAGYQETREMYSFARAIEAKLKEKNT